MTEVILLGGAPGVGKSAVARALAPHVGAVIELDTLWGMHGRPDYSDGNQFMRAMQCAVAMIPLLPGPVVLVSPWSREARAAFWPLLNGRRRARVVLLTASYDVLASRLAARPAWAYHDVQAATFLNVQHVLSGSSLIDTTDRSVDAVATEVRRLMSATEVVV